MKKTFLICMMLAALGAILAATESNTDPTGQILALERQTMDG